METNRRSSTGPRRCPPKECDGYPPVLLPRLLSENKGFVDVDFYVHDNNGPDLACTITTRYNHNNTHPDDDTNDNDSVIENIKKNIDRDDRRPVIIVCHGFLSWRNQMLISHVAAGLAKEMDCHAIRFDFRGNGSSGGIFRYAGYDDELTDLQRVVSFVRNDIGCRRVICIIGHSKGSAAILQFARNQQQQSGYGDDDDLIVPCFVNVAGKFTIPGDYDPTTRFSKEQCDELTRTGKFQLTTPFGREVEVTQQDIDERTNFDMSFVSKIDEGSSSVLTIHGSNDDTVSMEENAKRFDKTIPRHQLKIIEGADHNFNGLIHISTILSTICDFLRQRHQS